MAAWVGVRWEKGWPAQPNPPLLGEALQVVESRIVPGPRSLGGLRAAEW